MPGSRRSLLLMTLTILIILAIASSCSRESAGPDGDVILNAATSGADEKAPPRAGLRPDGHGYYAAYLDPDRVATNFGIAWPTLDAEEYSERILYDSMENAPDGMAYRAFVFYFAEGEDIWGNPLPVFWELWEEIAGVIHLMSGEPGGGGVPGVESIELTLTPDGPWEAPTNPDHVEGDPYPVGTLRRVYTADLLVVLAGDIPGDPTNAFQVQHQQEFHVIPVLVPIPGQDPRVEYRLWKWRHFGGWGLTEEVTWSMIKALYAS